MTVCCGCVTACCSIPTRLCDACCSCIVLVANFLISCLHSLKSRYKYCSWICNGLIGIAQLLALIGESTKYVCNCCCRCWLWFVESTSCCWKCCAKCYNFCVVFSYCCGCLLTLGMVLPLVVLYIYLFVFVPRDDVDATLDVYNEYEDVSQSDANSDVPDRSVDSLDDDAVVEETGTPRSKRNDTCPVNELFLVVDVTRVSRQPSTPTVGYVLPEYTYSNKSETNVTESEHIIPVTKSTDFSAVRPDFHISHRFMESVFNYAEKENIKDTLGLCRTTVTVKPPEYRANLFGMDQASDIVNCINDILSNTTGQHFCMDLDAEMSAYLRWLLLTGVPKEKQRLVPMIKTDDMLFPITCGADERMPLTQQGTTAGT